MGQRNNNLGWLQPRGVIGVKVREHDETGAIEDVAGRYRQCPTLRPGLRGIGVAERQVSGPELLREGESNAIACGHFASGILQYWKRGSAALGCSRRLCSHLRREHDQRCAQPLDFRVDCRKCLQFENTKGAPVAPQKADDDGPTIQKIWKIDEIAAPASKPEQGRCIAGFYGLGYEAGSRERLDRAARGIDQVGSAFASYSRRHTSSCAFNDIERHRTSWAEHVLYFSFPLTCGTTIVVICFIPGGNEGGPPHRDGSICPRR